MIAKKIENRDTKKIEPETPEVEDTFDADDTEQQSFEFDGAEDEDEAIGEPEGATPPQTTVGSTPVDFARLGITEMAYIRQAMVNSEPMWAIFSAAGDPLGAAASFDQAWAAVKQHNLAPMRVH